MGRMRSLLCICIGTATLAPAGCRHPPEEAAKPTLNVTFNGAIAFVPEGPSGSHYSRITALAAKADDRHLKGFDPAIHWQVIPIPAHYAYLRVKTRNLCEDATIRCVPRPQAGDATTLFPLYNDDLAIDPPPLAAGYVDGQSMASIPRLADVSDHGNVCAGCVDLDIQQHPDVPKYVAARLQFNTGSFGVTGSPDRDPRTGSILKWGFEHLPGLYSPTPVDDQVTPMPLYELTRWSSQLASREITLTLKNFNGGAQRKFKLCLEAGKSQLDIELLNLPASDLLGKAEGYDYEPSRIDHFDLLYILAKPSGNRLKYPFPYTADKLASSGGNPFCSNGILEP
jgi:hypothetical protein